MKTADKTTIFFNTTTGRDFHKDACDTNKSTVRKLKKEKSAINTKVLLFESCRVALQKHKQAKAANGLRKRNKMAAIVRF